MRYEKHGQFIVAIGSGPSIKQFIIDHKLSNINKKKAGPREGGGM